MAAVLFEVSCGLPYSLSTNPRIFVHPQITPEIYTIHYYFSAIILQAFNVKQSRFYLNKS
jgi:hypothetical protein